MPPIDSHDDSASMSLAALPKIPPYLRAETTSTGENTATIDSHDDSAPISR
eukprot:CAMPEP_0198646414 /NCGR_PEP_ID=MMETSP1467-20131203/1893_1 /TAXON_ID=1462469 /ORGANISM="unid. sp., Strain CCMP2135" /LENGTH=50 /DNA_ID=CAMNT_0044381955 /DNA_START=5 /DNA_END=153 /DNA_ORIENTATION=+